MFLAVERATGRRVAVKAVHTDWLDRRRLEFLRAEIEIHQEVSVHPYIVRLLGFYDDPEACFIVEEVAEGGSLLAHLHARSTMGTEREVCGKFTRCVFRKEERRRPKNTSPGQGVRCTIWSALHTCAVGRGLVRGMDRTLFIASPNSRHANPHSVRCLALSPES